MSSPNRRNFDNFDKLHNPFFEDNFKSMRRTAAASMVISLVLSLAVLGFLGWVTIKVMAHFGVL